MVLLENTLLICCLNLFSFFGLFFLHVVSTPMAKLEGVLQSYSCLKGLRYSCGDKCQALVRVDFLLPLLVPEDTLMFWKGIADVGLMEEVVCNIQKEIEEVLRGVQQRLGQSPFQMTGRLIAAASGSAEGKDAQKGSCRPKNKSDKAVESGW